jgi:hypothetical protein
MGGAPTPSSVGGAELKARWDDMRVPLVTSKVDFHGQQKGIGTANNDGSGGT